MGSSPSRHRRNNHHHPHVQHQNLLPSPPSSTATSAVYTNTNANNTSTGSGNITAQHNAGLPFYSTNTTQPLPLPSPSPTSYAFGANAPYHPPPPPVSAPSTTTVPPFFYNSYNHLLPPPLPAPRPPSFDGWIPNRQMVPVRPAQLAPAVPPPFVDHSHAKTVKNDVNVHKDSIKLVLDDSSPDSHLVSFVFDAAVDGSITIFYFAKEGDNCTFVPVYPDIMSRRVPFKKGLGQKFCQPSGTGIDLGFFELDQLSKPSPREDIFPLVISAEACLPSVSTGAEPDQAQQTASTRAQITQAVLEKSSEGHFQVKVIKQILWIDKVRYELREIYGIGGSDEASLEDNDTGKECVICMTEPKDTAVLPCRHLCLCSECANALRLQSDKCPICRQPIQELMGIKINEDSPTTS